MEATPLLRLNPQQLAQLLAHCVAYRAYLWQCVMPTPERNQTLRSIQALQGQLLAFQEQGQPERALPLSSEEAHLVKQLLSRLMQHYGNAPHSEQRTQALGELARLRVLVERTLRQTQALSEAGKLERRA